ncbi:MAG: hypothetical protein AAF900_02500, partial [Bacteroidota bacterium]
VVNKAIKRSILGHLMLCGLLGLFGTIQATEPTYIKTMSGDIRPRYKQSDEHNPPGHEQNDEDNPSIWQAAPKENVFVSGVAVGIGIGIGIGVGVLALAMSYKLFGCDTGNPTMEKSNHGKK